TISMRTLVPSHRSKAVGRVKVNGVPHSTIRLSAQFRTGGVVSTTIILWLQVVTLEQESIAVQVREIWKVFPQPCTMPLVANRCRFVPSHRSKKVGASLGTGVPHSITRLGGHCAGGGRVSTTVMIWLQKEALLQVSSALQVRVTLNFTGHW